MNILICDDMQNEIEKLIYLLSESGFMVNTTIFNNGYDALEYIHTGAVVDVCFLDIVMPEMSGITLAEQLRKDNFTGKIVFLTTSNEYAHESYQVKAFNYLLKPLTEESVRNTLDDLDKALKEGDTDGIYVNISGALRHIPFRDISYAEVIDHYVYFCLANGDIIEVFIKFSEVVRQLLNDSRFIQCHRSFIVNMHDVATIAEKEIYTRNGTRIPISRSYPETKSIYFKWKFGGKRL